MYARTTSRPHSSINSVTSTIPRWLAATCARRSAKLSLKFRVPELPSTLPGSFKIAVMPASWNSSPSTSLNDLNAAPSWTNVFECGGIEPGVMPPISAWCPRLATKKMGVVCPAVKTGVMTVMSGRCDPPAAGWLLTSTSPGWMSPFLFSIWYRTVSCIAPKCTGMCGAFAINPPFGLNSAQLKSSRSLMFTEIEVRCSARPISSAIDMNLCPKTDRWIESSSVVIACGTPSPKMTVKSPTSLNVPVQSGSSTTVLFLSIKMAGPWMLCPGVTRSKVYSGQSNLP